ncbi:transposase, Ptta/En/Spm [Tanacetum coccineum]
MLEADNNQALNLHSEPLEKQAPNSYAKEYYDMLEADDEALYEGCQKYSTLEAATRKLGSLKRTVRNKARVEGSIVESYLVNELSVHCSLYFDPRIETRLNREPRNFAPDIHCSSQADSRLNIFKVPSRRLFDTGTKRNLTNAEKHKAHTYILLNCEDVHPFLRLFDNYMMQEDPYIDEETLDRARDEKFAQWFKEHIQSNDGNEHLKVLARGPMRYVESYKGYFVNGYKFHTLKHGDATHTIGVYARKVLFKCDWFEPIQGVRVNRKHNLVDVKYKSKGCQNDPFILASQAEQVYYAPYPSMTKDLKDWWSVVKAAARSIYEVTQCSSEVVDDNVDVEDFFQENEMPICSNTADANKNDETISLVTQGEMEEVGDLDVGDAYMEVSENEEEFVDTYDDSDDDTELNLSDHFSDEDEVDLSDHSLNDYKSGRGKGQKWKYRHWWNINVSVLGNQGCGGGEVNFDDVIRSRVEGNGIGKVKGYEVEITGIVELVTVSVLGNQDANYDDGSRSEGRGRGRSGNIGIGGSNLMNPDSKRGRGRGRSGNIGIGGSSNVSALGNHERGRSGNIGIGGSSNVSGFGNQDADYDYDNGSISKGRGRGRSGNIGGRAETSQHVRGSNLPQSIPSHPSQRPMITLYYGGFAEGHITRDIISIFKVSFYGSWTSWREVDQESRDIMFEEFQDQYQWHPSENAAAYRAWEKVISSRFSDILGACRREAALRATEDNIKVGNDLSVLKPYTPSWIDQADWEDMINRVWNTSRWKKKSAIARQNRLSEVDGEVSKHTAGSITILQHKFKMEKQKQRPVSLLEAYQYTHTQETAEALGDGTDEGSGDGTDEAVGSGTREYITRRSKRVADAVEAAMEDEHGPDASQHPPNDFDLWGKATGGKKKGKLVGLGTRGGPRLMVTSRTSTSSSSSHRDQQPSEQLEEMVRQLQEDNAQMRARSEIEMQVQVQRQVESQLQEHMRQRELEANAHEEAREREWQQMMDDINSMLRKFNDPRPSQ